METAVSGVIIVGLSASLLAGLRYTQIVRQGVAVGEQLSTISEGAERYMKRYGRQIQALPASCAEPMYVFGGPANSTKPPLPTGCSLKLGDVTVENGYQPTVLDLNRLNLVRANDQLLLPFSPGVVEELATGDSAVARIAVWIRPVPNTTTGPGGTPGTGPLVAEFPSVDLAAGGSVSAATTTAAKRQVITTPFTRAALDLPPTINGVNCYNGESATIGTGTQDPYYSRENRLVIVDSADPNKVLPLYTLDEIESATQPGGIVSQGKARYFFNGSQYCRYMQEKFPEQWQFGKLATSGGTTTTPTPTPGQGNSDMALESVVFNTQPYYYGNDPLPLGASAQMGAALERAGFGGRLSTLRGATMAETTVMRGLYGHSESDNPIRSRDRLQGMPGILALVNLVADTGTTAGGGSGTGTSPTWDLAGHNLTNADLVQGQQIAGSTAVVGLGTSLPTQGRTAVMSVNGNMVMGVNSALIAHNVEAKSLSANQLSSSSVTADEVKINGRTFKLGSIDTTNNKFNFYIRNGANVRLPRVTPGTQCDPYSDVAMSRAVNVMQWAKGRYYGMTRFLLYCKPDRATNGNTHVYGTSTWTSPEYEAWVAQYPPGDSTVDPKKYDWVYFDSSPSDSMNVVEEPK